MSTATLTAATMYRLLFAVFLCLTTTLVSAGKTNQKGKDGKEPEIPAKVKYAVTDIVQFNITFTEKGKDKWGVLQIAVFGKTAPMTALNFVSIARGYKKGKRLLDYEGSHFHRIIPDFAIQGGDVINKDDASAKIGTGSYSIYGEFFDDENFILKHQGMGWVGMANNGRDSNGSQFYFSLQMQTWLNGRNIVFAKVVKGMSALKRISEVKTSDDHFPVNSVRIVESDVMSLREPWSLTQAEAEAETDIKVPVRM